MHRETSRAEYDAPNYAALHPGLPHSLRKISKKLVEIAQVELGLEVVERLQVPDDRASWDVEWPDYSPPMIDVPRGRTRFAKPDDFPDSSDPTTVGTFASLEAIDVHRDAFGRPVNPIHRTGLAGRGMLNKWGPNHAADPIVTRNNPTNGSLEVLLIQRSDTGDWALPGGKVDKGEEVWQTAGRELVEEAGVSGVTLDFEGAEVVYRGYVPDVRNTDSAWMETTALHIHLNPEQASQIRIAAGSDAKEAVWFPVNNKLYDTMYSGQGEYLRLATATVEARK